MTPRLDLSPPTREDLPALHSLMSDPAGWWYEPQNRHAEETATATFIELVLDGWKLDGLSYWVARTAALGIVGIGGVRRRAEDRVWNLSYRFRTDAQGKGFATEVATAGIEAAHRVDPDLPVIAWILESNAPSRRVAERVGLIDQGPRIDPADDQVRLAYSDRELQPVAASVSQTP